jgi:hypothetical protein
MLKHVHKPQKHPLKCKMKRNFTIEVEMPTHGFGYTQTYVTSRPDSWERWRRRRRAEAQAGQVVLELPLSQPLSLPASNIHPPLLRITSNTPPSSSSFTSSNRSRSWRPLANPLVACSFPRSQSARRLHRWGILVQRQLDKTVEVIAREARGLECT